MVEGKSFGIHRIENAVNNKSVEYNHLVKVDEAIFLG